jgi:Flp pilus assembly protein TadD
MNDHLKTERGEIDELVRAERYDSALERLEELTRQYPNEPSIWRTRAYMNSHQGNTEDAIDDVSKAIELCDLEPDYYFTRGRLFSKIS